MRTVSIMDIRGALYSFNCTTYELGTQGITLEVVLDSGKRSTMVFPLRSIIFYEISSDD